MPNIYRLKPAPTLALSPVHIRLSSLPLISRRRLGRAQSRASGRGRHSSPAKEAWAPTATGAPARAAPTAAWVLSPSAPCRGGPSGGPSYGTPGPDSDRSTGSRGPDGGLSAGSCRPGGRLSAVPRVVPIPRCICCFPYLHSAALPP